MDLESKFFLDHLADLVGDVTCKSLVDILFVVVNGNVWRFQVFDVNQHLEGIVQRHREKVQLIQSHLVPRDTFEETSEQVPVPIQESATCRLANVPLPVGNDVDLPGEKVEVLFSVFFQDVVEDKTLAMIHYSLSKQVEPSIKTLGDGSSKIR